MDLYGKRSRSTRSTHRKPAICGLSLVAIIGTLLLVDQKCRKMVLPVMLAEVATVAALRTHVATSAEFRFDLKQPVRRRVTRQHSCAPGTALHPAVPDAGPVTEPARTDDIQMAVLQSWGLRPLNHSPVSTGLPGALGFGPAPTAELAGSGRDTSPWRGSAVPVRAQQSGTPGQVSTAVHSRAARSREDTIRRRDFHRGCLEAQGPRGTAVKTASGGKLEQILQPLQFMLHDGMDILSHGLQVYAAVTSWLDSMSVALGVRHVGQGGHEAGAGAATRWAGQYMPLTKTSFYNGPWIEDYWLSTFNTPVRTTIPWEAYQQRWSLPGWDRQTVVVLDGSTGQPLPLDRLPEPYTSQEPTYSPGSLVLDVLLPFDAELFSPWVPLFLPWMNIMNALVTVDEALKRQANGHHNNRGTATAGRAQAQDGLASTIHLCELASVLEQTLLPTVQYITVVQRAAGPWLLEYRGSAKTDARAACAKRLFSSLSNVLVISAGGIGHVPIPLLGQERPFLQCAADSLYYSVSPQDDTEDTVDHTEGTQQDEDTATGHRAGPETHERTLRGADASTGAQTTGAPSQHHKPDRDHGPSVVSAVHALSFVGSRREGPRDTAAATASKTKLPKYLRSIGALQALVQLTQGGPGFGSLGSEASMLDSGGDGAPGDVSLLNHWGIDPRTMLGVRTGASGDHADSGVDLASVPAQEAGSQLWMRAMASSLLQLAPRGTGPTSFRLYEALQMGLVPVYVHDGGPWLPYLHKDESSAWVPGLPSDQQSLWARIAVVKSLEQLKDWVKPEETRPAPATSTQDPSASTSTPFGVSAAVVRQVFDQPEEALHDSLDHLAIPNGQGEEGLRRMRLAAAAVRDRYFTYDGVVRRIAEFLDDPFTAELACQPPSFV